MKSAQNSLSTAILIGLAMLISSQMIQAQVPAINLFSPSSGPVGTTVTLTGTNFSSTASSNIVWFGAVAAPVIAATNNLLTVLVPTNASQAPITASVNGLVCAAPAPFVVTYIGKGTFSTSSLAAAINLPSGNAPIGVKIVDLDGDGKPDLLVPNYTDSTISVYRNISTNGVLTLGSFAPAVNFAVGPQPRQVAVGEIDGDGKRDVVVANNGGTSVSIFRNISTPGAFTTNSFAARVDFTTGANPHHLALVDLNGDGKLDLAIGNSGGNTLSILRNTATVGNITASSFATSVDFPASPQSGGLAIGDMDGDGTPDVVLSSDSPNSISIFRNTTPVGNAAITFAAKVDFATPSRPYGGLSIGDLDGDGKLDIAVATYEGGTVSVFRNISTTGAITTNSLSPRFDLPTGGSTHAVLVVDIDGDSKSDLVAVSEYANTVAVFRNISTNGTLIAGSFAPRVDFSTASNPNGVAVGDLDGDGRPDVVAATAYGNVLSIFHNLNIPGSTNLPVIASQPANQTVTAGTNVVFTVTASGGEGIFPSVTSGTLKLWLKADFGVVTDVGRVVQWQDQSSNSNHAAQTDANRQPQFIGNVVPTSGKPVVRFDGIDSGNLGDFLQGTGDVGLPAGFTSFLVSSRANRVNSEQIVGLVGVPGAYNSVRSYYTSADRMSFAGWGNDYVTSFVIPPDSFRIWTDRLNSAKTQIELFDNDGNNAVSFTQNTSGLTTPGAGYFVGGVNSPSFDLQHYAFKGDVAEMIFFQNALSEPDRLAVENYLKQKYFQAPNPGAGFLAYQWSLNGTNILGATNSVLTLSNAQTNNAGSYVVLVSNNFGSVTSSIAVLTVNVPASISLPPQSQTVRAGSNANFTVTASGTSPLNYQWQFNGNPISGATNSLFTVNSAQLTNAGGYSVVVTNIAGSVTSAVAVLMVEAQPAI